jgi:hypothetical protein
MILKYYTSLYLEDFMGWQLYGDGLKLIGNIHYNESEINGLILKLKSRKRGNPETLCIQLNKFLETKIILKDLIWRLSKWCDWNDKSQDVALNVVKILFHGIVCRRLRDKKNNPIPDNNSAKLDYDIWRNAVVSVSNDAIQDTVYQDEVDDINLYEGAKKVINVNAYERNRNARKKCIEHYGATCVICGFDFNKNYEGIGEGFIHVHHIVPISKINREYKIDPINDLRPVCPNCHAVIHKFKEPYSIEEVKNMLNKL